ncbi:MAG: fatty acid desaturase [Campylobacterales bacterium]|nr:fatty acid desaturase [Campylobacterales bacterium]
MSQSYTPYQNIDQIQLQKDIEQIKETIGSPSQEDFKHLLKLERWGRASSAFGFLLLIGASYLEMTTHTLNPFAFWSLLIVASIFIGVGNVSRWANVAHPVLHGAYDKVPNIPHRYTKAGFASGRRRIVDWLDWIKPSAWVYEHNTMHHYHLGEDDDPDNVEKNMLWLTTSKVPMWARYLFVFIFAGTWKLTYYAPNTLRILQNKERRKKGLEPIKQYQISPWKPHGYELWQHYILPYFLLKFVAIPLLFYPIFGWAGVANALIVILMAEYVANIHSFLVIVPNHSAEDIYRFEEPHKSQGEFYLRQIMGSVNYNTCSDLIDFGHGWLNYQIEHHLFPNLPLSQYQKMQPIVKEICAKHNLEYRQESVFKRMWMTIELMVGKTKLLRVKGV